MAVGAPEVLFGQGDAQLHPRHAGQSHDHAESLGQNGGQGRAHGTHPHGTDQQVIQTHIDHARHGHKIHWPFGVSKAPEYAADHVIGGDKGDACEADGQILPGFRHRLRRRGQRGQDAVGKQQQQGGGGQGKDSEDDGCAADAAGGGAAVSRADGAADGHRAAHGQTHNDDGQHVGDLTAHGHGGYSGRAVELSGDEQIGKAVKGLQKAGKEVGQ